jgi:hypothetical protein
VMLMMIISSKLLLEHQTIKETATKITMDMVAT